MNLTGIDVYVLVSELKQTLVGSWIVNIYHLPSGIFIFKIRKPKEGLLHLLIEPGKRIHLTQFNRTMPKEPSNFCKTLRKHLRDKRINSIEQRDLDRIVMLNIGPDEGYTLVIELFGRGNLILASPQNKIITASSYRKMRDRDIHPGREFIQMPQVEYDILRANLDELPIFIKDSGKLVPALNAFLGLGPYYSRFILSHAEIKTNSTKALQEDQLMRIKKEAQNLKNVIQNEDFEPVVYLDREEINQDDELEDEERFEASEDSQWSGLPFNPEQVVKILPWKQMKGELLELDSLNSGFDIFFSSQEEEEEITEETVMLSSELERLQNQLTQQLSHQRAFVDDAAHLRRDADVLYEHFQTASELLEIVYNARRNNMSWEDIEARLQLGKEKGIAAAQIYESLEIDRGMINLHLPSDDEVRKVRVDFRKSLTELANDLYTKAKKTESKAHGADKAITLTREKIMNAEENQDNLEQRVAEQVVILKRRKPWYEKWHWTRADNGQLIIAGFDAATNERLVKTYFDGDDLFLHADIQGAAATIIKNDGKEIPENTKRVAAAISVSYSSAWKLKRPTADAYIVSKDQVSLSAPSGQYLPKGGFMIYGEREYVNDVSLMLFVGLVIEQHWARIIIGTSKESKVLESCRFIAEVVPGNDERGTIAKKIKREFIRLSTPRNINKVKALDIGEIAKVIPGPSKIEAFIRRGE